MERIIVKAERIGDSGISKFDALIKEYEAAKRLADETVETKQPIVDAIGEKKLQMIDEQLDTIASCLQKICEIRGRCGVCTAEAYAYLTPEGYGKVSARVRYYVGGDVEKRLDGWDIDNRRQQWFDINGVVTKWNEYHLYEKLLTDCQSQLRSAIDEQKRRMNKVNTILENMNNDSEKGGD